MGNQQAADSPSSDCDQHGVMQPLSLDPRNLLSRAIFGSPEATLKTLPEEKPPDSEQQSYTSHLFPSDISALISNVKLGNPCRASLKVLPEERVISLRIGAHGDSLLHVASEHGNIAVVKQLVEEYKCSPLIYNNNECTSMHSAAKGGNLPVLKYLIGICKENASASNEGGGNERESREEAVEGKMKNEKMIIVPYDPAVQAASKDFPDNNDDSESAAEATSGSCYSIDKCGNSLLHVSSIYGYLEIAVYLCSDTEAGITMMAPNIDGQNPLHLAAKHGRFEVVEYLTTLQNCTPSARENEGRNALHLAIDGGHLKIVQFLVEGSFCNPADTVGRRGSYVTKTSTVHIAAQRGHLEILKYLVDIAGCNLYERDGCDNLPIHLAVIHGHLNVVEHLISEKWHNPFCRGEGDKTVVHMASQYGHLDILQFFVERVKLMPYHQDIADFLSADKNKYLIYFETFLKTLLPNYQRKRRNTTLLQNDVKRLYGCRMKSSLIKSIKSGDFELKNAIGFIDSAVSHYRAIQSKIYKFCSDVDGRSPLHYACMEGHVHIAKFLIEVCNMNHLCTDNIGDTPLHFAAKRGHMNAVKYLIEERHSTILCRNKFSLAPLHYAACEGKLGIVQYILTKTECDSMLKESRDGTALHCASFCGHLEVVKYLCDVQGVDPSCVDMEQCTPLHEAAAMGHLHVVKFFIEKSSPSQNKYIKNKSTPVHLSAYHGHLNVMEYLVTSTGFDYLCKGNKGRTLAHYATMKGHLHILKHLFQESPKIFNIRDELQCTPLHVAAQYGQLKVLKYLAEDMKCNILCLDEKNNTPLHLAAKAAESQKECHLKVVKYLITKHRCDPLSKGSSRMSPLHVACESSQHSIVECMLENIDAHNLSACLDEDNNTPLHTASLQGSLTIVKLLTEKDQKQIVVRNKLFHTPLHTATLVRHLNVVKYFIEERNCKSLLQDPAVSPTVLACTNGPLHLAKYLMDVMNKNQLHTEVSMRSIILSAVIGGQTDLIQYCSTCSYLGTPENSKHRAFHSFEVSTDPCTVFFLANSEGQTIIGYRIHLPLHLACVTGQLHIAKYFIERFSVNHNQKTCDGFSTLHLAAYSGNVSLVKYLVEERNCSVQVTDNDQRQPLHHAIMTNRLNVVKYFLTKEGCDIKTTIKYGFNSLHLACLHAKVEMVDYLIHDAILTSTDSMGRTPLHLAVLTNNMDVVKYFVERLAYDPTASISSEHISPFQFASRCGRLQLLRYFIHERKCDPMLKNNSGKSLVHLASSSGHVKVVQYLVENCDVDINCQDENQHTSLHYSACECHIEVVKYLVSKNCVVQMRGSKNNTALHLAAAKGHLAIVKFLVEEAKCDPMLEGELKRTVFQFACGNGRFEIVKYLHEEIHLSLFHVDSQKLSLLHLSAMCGSLPITQYLIGKSCDAFQTDLNHNMPLHIAAMNGRFELVKYLLEHMKGYMFTGYAGRTAFHYAALTGSLQIVKYIDQKYSVDLDFRDQYQFTPLHLASFKGKLEVVEYLIERGCDVSLQDYKLLTPFHYAVIEGHLKTVEYFISRNLCDASLKGPLQRTAVHIASFWGQLDIVKLLVEACKVNIHCRDQQRHTPLHLAARNGHLDICKYLVEKGSDPSCTNEHDQTPLHLAAHDGHIDVVKYLSEYCHCDVLRKDKDNTVALHFAAIGGRLNITKYLILTCKCDPECRTSNGTIPLHFACRSGHLHIVKYYVDDLSINPLYPDDVGNTPLHLAALKEQMDIVEYLVEKKHCSTLINNKHNMIPLQTAIMHMKWKAIKYFTHEQLSNLNEAKKFLSALVMAAVIHDDLDLVERCFKLGPIDFSAKRIATITTKPLPESNFITNASGIKYIHRRTIDIYLPVHMASIYGRLSILKCLIKLGSDPDLLDHDYTPLHLAALNGQLHIVKYLVESHNCKVNRKDKFLNTPLHLAVVGNHLKVVKYLITEKGCNPMQKAEEEFTCLHFACNKGGIDMVKFLLEECKANPLCFSRDGDSPLHIAAFRGYLHIVKYLLENHFCEPGMKTKYRNIALYSASIGGRIEVVKYLIGHNDPLTTPLKLATVGGHLHVVRFLIDQCKVPIDSETGTSLLHVSSKLGHLDLVKYLTTNQHSDSSSPATESDRTPLHTASFFGHLHVVQCLIEECNVDIALEDDDGYIPIHLACISGHLDIIKYMLDLGNNNIFKVCSNLVFLAAKNGHLEIVKFLAEEMVWSLDQMVGSKRPLDIAHEEGHTDIVRYLFTKGCQSDIVQSSMLARPPLKPNVSMFVIGNTEAGKTTLIKSLQSPSSHTLTNWVMGLFKSVETPSETTGIVPTRLQTDQLSNITAYDFAGPMEYYAGHKAFLEGISSSIIVITIDISHSVEASVKSFLYWHMFIRSITNESSVVRVLIAASHSDKLQQKEVNPHISGIQDNMEKKQSNSVMYVACIPLDCRDTASQGFSKLTDIVDSCYRMVCLELDLDYDNGSVLNVFLKTKFSQTTVCPLSTIHDSLTKINAPDLVPLKTPEILLGACKTLQESGYIEIILLELPSMTEVFIIQKTEQFLTKVNSRVKHTKFPNANGLGLVSYSMLEQFLKKEFNDTDIISQVVIQYMVTKQFCSKVMDPEIIRKVAEVITVNDEDIYFFPHLIQLDQPDGIWMPNPEFSYTCGWTLKCIGNRSFFYPRYFQNLFLRMAVKFALTPSIQRRSSRLEPSTGFKLWKNGVRWLDSAGIEVVVMVSGDQNTVLTLLMRCRGEVQLQVVKLRSYLVKEVFLVKNKYSPRCKTKEYLIHPHCLNHCPPHMPVEIEISKVLVAIVRKEPNLSLDAKRISDAPGYPFLSIRDLHCYEGYAELGPALLHNLLTDENRHVVIDDNTLKQLAATMQGKCPSIEQVLGISADSSSQKEPVRIADVLRRWSSETGGKYGTLRDALDQYSLFAKRSSEVCYDRCDIAGTLKYLFNFISALSLSEVARYCQRQTW